MQFDDHFAPLPPSGSEDCLYLNIHRPRVSHSKPLNVIVFVHGGGFYTGTNNPLMYGPDFFMETGQVIMVSISYRLNIFGFLATGDEASPGNYGLKDVTMALRWVQRHIGAFGGDPQKVTLMGHSAGSIAVNYHVISRHSEGLYKNAVLLSGTYNNKFGAIEERPRLIVNRHARVLGIKNAAELSSEALVEVLRKIPARDLTAAVQKMTLWDILPVAAFKPVVEPHGSPDPFLTSHPDVRLATGDIVQVPILATNVIGDGINLVQPLIRLHNRHKDVNADMYRILPIVLEMDPRHPNMTEIVNRIRFRYFDRRGVLTPSNFDGAVRMASEYFFNRPYYEACQGMARHTPVYGQQFNYKGLNSFVWWFTKTHRDYGVVHGDDVLYLFRMSGLFPYQLTPAEKQVSKAYMKHVMSFIKYSYPGYPAWNSNDPMMMQFGRSKVADIALKQIHANPLDFWRQIDDLYRPKYYNEWSTPAIGNFTWMYE